MRERAKRASAQNYDVFLYFIKRVAINYLSAIYSILRVYRYQACSQDFSRGIDVLCEGAKRPSGGRVWEGDTPLPQQGLFTKLEYQNRILEHLKTAI